MYFIIAYDSPSDRRRRQLMNLLKDHLAHVQESVFEGRLAPSRFQDLVTRIRRLMDPKVDSVRIYRMPPSSWHATTVIGLPPLETDRPVVIVTASPAPERSTPVPWDSSPEVVPGAPEQGK
ncbi:MAG: hypothetical protein OZSIB_1608 [Candidatus Ozemobacter sibiricus]|jgi:CRISPR-associated protein Cas2|uniref:CRISPR-associated endoribonuclease Cas2 n=1 Tax=Candidatus Ozemobacter sibiricus TaxID=2268124 RepID=A0A367ZLI1_9BACT|nr:MAG: hypothetical protein OZSIB_1608 [Candidatus Ozemobacter sibiricus]